MSTQFLSLLCYAANPEPLLPGTVCNVLPKIKVSPEPHVKTVTQSFMASIAHTSYKYILCSAGQ